MGEVDLSSVGPPLDGVEVRFDDNNGLYIRGAMVMQGYWKQPQATARVLDRDGWLHSGDLARLDDKQHLHIIGRSKALIVLSNGENIAPETIETMLLRDPCIEQAILVGEGKPWLSVLIVPNREQLAQHQASFDQPEQWMLQRITHALASNTPHYETIRACLLLEKPWSQQEGMITATQKLKRHAIMARYHKEIEALYQAE